MYTLLELERVHGCPMLVWDTSNDYYYEISSVSPDSFAMYLAKPIKEDERKALPGTPSVLLYGGFAKWIYKGRPSSGPGIISPEEQRRALEEERRRTNERITRELSQSKRRPTLDNLAKPVKEKDTSPSNSTAKVIPFVRKPKDE